MDRKLLAMQVSLVFIVAIIFSSFSGCVNSAVNPAKSQVINNSSPMSHLTNDSGQILVAVSVPPQEEFVERVGGDRIKVVCLLPPGADCCEYDPTAEKLAEAKAKNITTVFVTPEFNPDSAREMAGELGATMAEIDPLAPDYVENMNNASQTIARSMK